MKRAEAFPSKYWRAADLEQPVVLVIDDVVQEILEGEDSRLCTIMSFVDHDKRLIINVTNWNILEDALGVDSEDWRGKRIRLVRERVTFRGKPTFGVRVQVSPAVKAPKPKASQPVEDDDAELAERESVLSEADAEWESV